MPKNSNIDRAHRIIRLLERFYRNGENDSNVIDCLTDLLHAERLCGDPVLDLGQCLRIARDHLKTETTETSIDLTA